jgi:hypothetical protein
MLSPNEKNLIADALNGCGTLIESDPNYLALMAGPDHPPADLAVIGRGPGGRPTLTGPVVSCGLEHELLDAMRLDAIDTKWQVDGVVLLEKVRALTQAQRTDLIQRVAHAWACYEPDAGFATILADIPH